MDLSTRVLCSLSEGFKEGLLDGLDCVRPLNIPLVKAVKVLRVGLSVSLWHEGHFVTLARHLGPVYTLSSRPGITCRGRRLLRGILKDEQQGLT